MFLRHEIRRTGGKEHRAWSMVENRRVEGGRVVRRQVVYLGEINDSHWAAGSRAVDVFDEGGRSTQISLFSEDRVAPANRVRFNIVGSKMEVGLSGELDRWRR